MRVKTPRSHSSYATVSESGNGASWVPAFRTACAWEEFWVWDVFIVGSLSHRMRVGGIPNSFFASLDVDFRTACAWEE